MACGFVLSCAATSFALIAIVVRFARTPRAPFESFRNNAFGVYLVHYAIVTWLQYALLSPAMGGFAKGVLVTAGGAALSWALVAALRRIPVVARTI